jgi:hypothetical protein
MLQMLLKVLVGQIHGSEMDRRENVSISIDQSTLYPVQSQVFWIIMGVETCDRDIIQHVQYAAVHGGKRTITSSGMSKSNGRRDKKNSEPHFFFGEMVCDIKNSPA